MVGNLLAEDHKKNCWTRPMLCFWCVQHWYWGKAISKCKNHSHLFLPLTPWHLFLDSWEVTWIAYSRAHKSCVNSTIKNWRHRHKAAQELEMPLPDRLCTIPALVFIMKSTNIRHNKDYETPFPLYQCLFIKYAWGWQAEATNHQCSCFWDLCHTVESWKSGVSLHKR